MKWHGPARLPGPELVESIICAIGNLNCKAIRRFVNTRLDCGRRHADLNSDPVVTVACRRLPPIACREQPPIRQFGTEASLTPDFQPDRLAVAKWATERIRQDLHFQSDGRNRTVMVMVMVTDPCRQGSLGARSLKRVRLGISQTGKKLRNRSVRAVTCGCCNAVPVARYALHKHNFCDGAGPFGAELNCALGPVLVRRENDPGIRAEVQLPEHVTGQERGHQQILRITVVRRLETWIGRTSDDRFSRARNVVIPIKTGETSRSVAAITHPCDRRNVACNIVNWPQLVVRSTANKGVELSRALLTSRLSMGNEFAEVRSARRGDVFRPSLHR